MEIHGTFIGPDHVIIGPDHIDQFILTLILGERSLRKYSSFILIWITAKCGQNEF